MGDTKFVFDETATVFLTNVLSHAEIIKADFATSGTPNLYVAYEAKAGKFSIEHNGSDLILRGKVFPDPSNPHLFLEVNESIAINSKILGTCVQEYNKLAQGVKKKIVAAFDIVDEDEEIEAE